MNNYTNPQPIHKNRRTLEVYKFGKIMSTDRACLTPNGVNFDNNQLHLKRGTGRIKINKPRHEKHHILYILN